MKQRMAGNSLCAVIVRAWGIFAVRAFLNFVGLSRIPGETCLPLLRQSLSQGKGSIHFSQLD